MLGALAIASVGLIMVVGGRISSIRLAVVGQPTDFDVASCYKMIADVSFECHIAG
jgi:hypothetical protein